MYKTNNLFAVLTVSFLLLLTTIGCNMSSDAPSASTEPSANSSTASDKPAPVQTADKDIAGTYNITGTNEGGGGQYAGTLEITKRDAVYQFSWASGGRTYDGVGVQSGDMVAVSFSEGADGKGCGVVLYDIASNGNLSGKAGYWGVNKSESEKALKDTGSGLEGRYEVSGTNPEGKPYKSTLNVAPKGDGFSFEWAGGANPVKGFGVRMGDNVAVGLGKSTCGFVMYQINADGSLDGKWGSQGSTRFGTENAKKK